MSSAKLVALGFALASFAATYGMTLQRIVDMVLATPKEIATRARHLLE